MVTPKRAWSPLASLSHQSEPSVLRLVIIGALLFSAFHLHERASRLEERERSFQQRIGAFARQTRAKNERVGTSNTLDVSLHEIAEATPAQFLPASSPTFKDRAVRQAEFLEESRPIAIRTRDH